MEFEQEEVLDIREIIHIIVKRWWILALCFLVSVIGMGIISYFVLEPIYTSKTTLFVGRQQTNEPTAIQYNDIMLNQQLVKDYRELAKSRVILKEVIKNLNLATEVDEVIDNIEVSLLKDTRLFEISFSDANPERATTIANELAKVFINKATDIMKVENIQVIDVAEIPKSPSKPNKILNILIGGILGIIIGLGIIVLIEYLDNTIKTPDDVEKYLGINVIGAIPMINEKEVE